jgi:cbb3-type cytochrome oxidase maturation protein
MDVVIGLVTISLALVALGLVFFFTRLKGGDFDHGERLSLLPLREDKERDAADTAKGAGGARPKPEDHKEGGVANGRG